MIDLSRLWITEWIVIGFFVYLIVLAIAHRIDRSSRLRVIRVGLVCIAFATMLSQLRLSPVLQIVREWVPAGRRPSSSIRRSRSRRGCPTVALYASFPTTRTAEARSRS